VIALRNLPELDMIRSRQSGQGGLVMLKPFLIRIERKYIKKLAYIGARNGRSINMEIRQVLIKYIDNFEHKYEKIEVDDKD
jgi:hypothetical protein